MFFIPSSTRVIILQVIHANLKDNLQRVWLRAGSFTKLLLLLFLFNNYSVGQRHSHLWLSLRQTFLPVAWPPFLTKFGLRLQMQARGLNWRPPYSKSCALTPRLYTLGYDVVSCMYGRFHLKPFVLNFIISTQIQSTCMPITKNPSVFSNFFFNFNISIWTIHLLKKGASHVCIIMWSDQQNKCVQTSL